MKDLYNIDIQEQVTVHMCSFDGDRTSKYFEGQTASRTEVEVRLESLKNGKSIRLKREDKE